MKILEYPNSSLNQKAEHVDEVSESTLIKIDKMLDLMYSKHGVGLSSNQVGMTEAIFVMDCSEDRDEPSCFINPRVITGNGDCFVEEGCLSFPNVMMKVPRFETVVIEYMDINGTILKKTFNGLESICVQHEIDHLEGKTFLDRVNRETRRSSLKKMRKRRSRK